MKIGVGGSAAINLFPTFAGMRRRNFEIETTVDYFPNGTFPSSRGLGDA